MIKPLADKVLVEPKEAETKTASGLYIPDTAKEKPQQGVVIAVGPGKRMSLWSSRPDTWYSTESMPVPKSAMKTKSILS